MAQDTTTRLNAATTTGDLMDESLVVQTDGTTEAKRPRVVLGSDAGDLYDAGQPVPVLLCGEDRARLDRLADLLEQLVLLNGGLL